MLLASAVFAYMPALRGYRAAAVSIAGDGDPETRDDLRYAELLAWLPSSGRVGYLINADWPSAAAQRRYYLAQYSLTPRIVVMNTEPEFLVVEPQTDVTPETAKVDPRLAGFALVRRMPDGTLVFRRSR